MREVKFYAVAAVLSLVTSLFADASLPSSARAAAPCSTLGYSQGACVVVPRSGSFTVKVPSTSIILRGTGTTATAGTQIVVAKVSTPAGCSSTKEDSFKLFASGKMPKMSLSSAGKLYSSNPGNDSCSLITSITAPGLYVVVYPGGTIPCDTQGFSQAACYTVPKSGGFSAAVPGTRISLTGVGNAASFGTQLLVAHVSNFSGCISNKEDSFKLFASGTMPSLKTSSGKLYVYNSGTAKCTQISSLAGPGSYAVVYAGGTTPHAVARSKHGHKGKKKH